MSFILLITRTPLERWPSSESVSGKDLLMNKRTRSCDVGLSVTSSDEILAGDLPKRSMEVTVKRR